MLLCLNAFITSILFFELLRLQLQWGEWTRLDWGVIALETAMTTGALAVLTMMMLIQDPELHPKLENLNFFTKLNV